MNKRRILIIATLVALVAAAIPILKIIKQDDFSSTPHSFGVSINLPLTGPIAFPGKSFQEAALLALDDLKKESTSKSATFDWNDNTGSPATAATIAKRQVLSDTSIYLVGYSAETLAVQPILSATSKPIFSFSFMASITKEAQIFRNLISFKAEYPIFVKYAKKRQSRKIAIIFADLPEPREEFEKFVIPELVLSGWKESDFVMFPYAVMETDFRTIVAKLAQASPDLIIINGFNTTLAPIVMALRNSQLVRDGNVIGTFDLIDVPKLIGDEAVEGMALATPKFLIAPSKKALDFQNRFQSRYGRQPSYSDFAGYDFVLIVNDLASRLPNTLTPQQLIDAIQRTNIEGVSGHITFDQDGDASPLVTTAVFRSGQLTPLE